MSPSTPWTRSPAYADLEATLVEMGLLVDPNPATGRDWPTADPVVNLRFQRRWTARMLARTGIAPDERAGPQYGARAYSADGRQRRGWDAALTPDAVRAVLPTEPRMGISLNEINRRLKRRYTRDHAQLKVVLRALHGDGLAASTTDHENARGRVFDQPRSRWYRVA